MTLHFRWFQPGGETLGCHLRNAEDVSPHTDTVDSTYLLIPSSCGLQGCVLAEDPVIFIAEVTWILPLGVDDDQLPLCKAGLFSLLINLLLQLQYSKRSWVTS